MVNLLISVLAGLLLTGAFAPLSIWWLAPLSIAMHMYSLSRSARPFLNSFICACVFNAVALHWTSIYVGALPWIILCLGQSLLFLPLGFATKYGMHLYPLIFLVLEELRSRFPFGGFGWLRLAFSQADSPYRKIAAYGGVSALSAAVLCSALVIFILIRRRINLLALLPLVFIFVPFATTTVASVKVLMVQGNVPQLGLDFNSRAMAVFSNHLKETQLALQQNSDVDFVLWPENAVDVDPFTHPSVAKALNSLEKPLIIGAVIRSQGQLQNASIHWTKSAANVYLKQHLTPFGEYIPLRGVASAISPLVDFVEDFSPGRSGVIFTEKKAKIAPVICFELLDDQILHQAAIASNLLVVQTNSATFGVSPQNAQQLEISRIRAIEHGRNTLSVSTTGVSAVIDYQGDLLEKTALHTAAHIFTKVDLLEHQTPRDKAGDWALVGTASWLLVVAMAGRRRYT